METFDRTEGFCPDGISIDYGKLFHIHGFVAVDKTDGERYRVDGAARYAMPGHISEALQDLLRVICPGTGRVLMVGSGGASVDVSEQPAVRIRRISTIVRKIYCRIAIERLLL